MLDGQSCTTGAKVEPREAETGRVRCAALPREELGRWSLANDASPNLWGQQSVAYVLKYTRTILFAMLLQRRTSTPRVPEVGLPGDVLELRAPQQPDASRFSRICDHQPGVARGNNFLFF